jgi:hypothetical protein
LAAFLVVFLAAFFVAFFVAFFAGRREDFFAAGRRSSSDEEAEALEAGLAGVAAGVDPGEGVGSEGSGSIQPEPDQPISI